MFCRVFTHLKSGWDDSLSNSWAKAVVWRASGSWAKRFSLGVRYLLKLGSESSSSFWCCQFVEKSEFGLMRVLNLKVLLICVLYNLELRWRSWAIASKSASKRLSFCCKFGVWLLSSSSEPALSSSMQRVNHDRRFLPLSPFRFPFFFLLADNRSFFYMILSF